MEENMFVFSKNTIEEICTKSNCTLEEGIYAIGSIAFTKIVIPNETVSIENRKFDTDFYGDNTTFNDYIMNIRSCLETNEREDLFYEYGIISKDNVISANNTYKLVYEIKDSDIIMRFEGANSLMAESVRDILANVIDVLYRDINIKIRSIKPLSEEAEQALIKRISTNDRIKEYKDETIIDIIEKEVVSGGDKIAVRDKNTELTYAEYNSMANRIANSLIELGVKKGDVVGHFMPSDVRGLIAVLGIIKSGALFMPIVKSMPQDRITYMVNNSDTKYIITISEYSDLIREKNLILDYEKIINCQNEENPHVKLNNDDSYGCLYTSGSTGRPKGVSLAHWGLYEAIFPNFRDKSLKFKNTIACTPMSFIMTVLEMIMPLAEGKSCFVCDTSEMKDLDGFRNTLCENNINTLIVTPSYFDVLTRDEKETRRLLSHLNLVILAGEKVYINDVVKKVKDEYNLSIYDIYGMTELHSVAYRKIDDEFAEVPPYAKIMIKNQEGDLLPKGIKGEIYVASTCATNGYINNEEETNKRCFRNQYGRKKIFRTGDIGMIDEIGDLKLFGRSDYQVKVRGYRIELKEVENVLNEIEEIEKGIIVDRETENHEKFLCGFYEGSIDEEEVIKKLSEKLPNYMIPSFCIKLEKLPKLISGKYDLNKLRTTELSEYFSNYVEPENETQRILCEIWSSVLGVEKVGIKDNFFKCGGDSIKLHKVLAKINNELNKKLSYIDFFENLTVEKLSKKLNDEIQSIAVWEKAEEKEFYDMTPSQVGIYLDNSKKSETSYNLTYILKVSGNLDFDKCNECIKTLVQRHEALRTTFHYMDNRFVQKIHDDAVVDCEELDNSIFNDEYINNNIEKYDLDKLPLFKVKIANNGDESHILLDIHHIIADGFSVNLFLDEFGKLYRGDKLEELEYQFKDYSERYASGVYKNKIDKSNEYWIDELNGNNTLLVDFLGDKPSFEKDDACKVLKSNISEDLAKSVKDYCWHMGITEHMFYLSCFALLIKLHTNQNEFSVGMPVVGREEEELMNVMGMVVKTLPIVFDIDENLSFNQYFDYVKNKCINAFDNQYLALEDIKEKTIHTKQGGIDELFNVMFVYQNNTKADARINDNNYLVDVREAENKKAKYDLLVEIDEEEGKVTIGWEYLENFFDITTVKAFANHYVQIVKNILSGKYINLNELTVCNNSDFALLKKFNNAVEENKNERNNVVDMFKVVVKEQPGCCAIKGSDESLTYSELDFESDKVAEKLCSLGVKSEDIVPFVLDRNSNIVVAMLGILKAGCAYLPIDSSYPVERIDYMIKDSGAKIIITDENNKESAGDNNVLLIDEARRIDEPHFMPVKIDENNLCYCIYTSGSTGKPKGTLVEHRTIVNLINWQNKETDIESKGNILAGTTIGFDVATQEIFTALLSGGKLVMIPDGVKKNINEYCGYIEDEKIDVMFCTPSYLDLIAGDDRLINVLCENVKDIILAGEKLVINDRLAEILNKNNVRVHNHYGPTESHVVTAKTYVNGYQKDGGSIGKPISNTEILILNSSGNMVPVGCPGELCIAGKNVGRGYLNRDELTEEKFVECEYCDSKIYKTGDLARWRNDGEIQFLGRKDDQIKLRGLRIELGEIKSVISKYQGIKDVAVIILNKEHEDFLAAYIVSDEKIDTYALKKEIARELPNYMVPDLYKQIDKIPLSPNGKMLTKLLPDIEWNGSDEYVEPVNETQRVLCEIFERVLEKERIGIRDDFFNNGGHSLKAMKLLNEIESEFDKRISFKDLMSNTTVEELESLVNDNAASKIVITKAEKKDKYIATSSQHSIYVASSMGEDKFLYNIPYFLKVNGKIDFEKLEKVINKIINQNSALKTTFEIVDEKLYQIINDEMHVNIEIKDSVTECIDKFDLKNGPLIHVCYSKNDEILVVDTHHIISDGITSINLIEQIVKGYRDDVYDEDNTLQYYDYSEWIRSNKEVVFAEQKEYWKKKFEDEIPVLDIHTDYNRPLVRNYVGRTIKSALDGEIYEKINDYCESRNTTPYVVMLTALSITLSKYARQNDLVIGTPVSGRTVKDVENMLGLFVETLPLRFNINYDGTVDEYVSYVKNECAETFSNQDYPVDDAISELGIKKDSSRNNLYDVVFNLHSDKYVKIDMGTAQLEEVDMSSYYNISKFDMNINVHEDEEKYDVLWEYSTELYNETTIEGMIDTYRTILEEIISKKVEKMSELKTYSEDDYNRILNEYNSDEYFDLRYTSIGEAFVDVVKKNETKEALVYEDNSYTFKELKNAVFSYANELQKLGVKSGDRVAVCVNRDEKIVFYQLAVLTIGGIFVPIDIDYPDDRVRNIINDAEAKAIIYDGDSEEIKSEYSTVNSGEIIIDGSVTEDEVEVKHNILDQECYNIFTSGSTGKPKGCRLTNKGILNFCVNNNVLETVEKISNPTGISVNSVSFDFFIAETLLMILNGCKVVLANSIQQVEQGEFGKVMVKNNVNIIQTTPTRLSLYMENKDKVEFFKQFEMIVLSGEELKKDFFKELKGITQARIYNPCGPSEASVWVAGGNISDCEKDLDKELHIGSPLKNCKLYVVDQYMNLLKEGIPGELVIGGICVGLGYINNDLTDKKFIANPFGDGKVYCTGDLVSWNQDGNIRYHGRIDQQVKIKGIRIEIGEVEEVMKKYPSVTEAFVIVKESNGNKELWGYYIADETVEVKELRSFMMTVLPKYMIPIRMMQIDEIIYNTNGKIDRKSFPEIPLITEEKISYVFDGNTEFLDVVSNVLSIEDVSPEDDFFELGGDSIKAIRLVTKFRELGYDVTVKKIMESQSINDIIDSLEMHENDNNYQEDYVGTVEKTPIVEEFNEWNLRDVNHFNQAYFINIAKENYSLDNVKKTMECLVKQHDILRSKYVDGSLVIDSYEENRFYNINEYDVKDISNKEQFIFDKCTENHESMNIYDSEMIKICAFVDEDSVDIMFGIHHLLIDGVSWRIFMDDFEYYYKKYINDEDIILREKTAYYAKWAEKLKEYSEDKDLLNEVDYWNEVVSKISQVPGKKNSSEILIKESKNELDSNYTKKLQLEVNKSFHTEINDILLATLVKTIKDVSDNDVLSVSMEGHGREDIFDDISIDRTIGWFTSIYPVVLAYNDDIDKLIINTKENLRKVPNNGIGFGILKCYKDMFENGEKPSVCLNYLGEFGGEQKENSMFKQSKYAYGKTISDENQLSNDISINCMIIDQKFIVEISYDSCSYDEKYIDDLSFAYCENLKEIIDYCTNIDEAIYSPSDFGDSEIDSDDLAGIMELFD